MPNIKNIASCKNYLHNNPPLFYVGKYSSHNSSVTVALKLIIIVNDLSLGTRWTFPWLQYTINHTTFIKWLVLSFELTKPQNTNYYTNKTVS